MRLRNFEKAMLAGSVGLTLVVACGSDDDGKVFDGQSGSAGVAGGDASAGTGGSTTGGTGGMPTGGNGGTSTGGSGGGGGSSGSGGSAGTGGGAATGGAAGSSGAAGVGGGAGAGGGSGSGGGAGAAGTGGAAGSSGSSGASGAAGSSGSGGTSGSAGSSGVGGAAGSAGASGTGGSSGAAGSGGSAGAGGGGTDAGTVTFSRITAYIPPNIVTFDAETAGGTKLHFDAGAAFDHDGTPGETVFGISADQRWELNVNNLRFENQTALVDPLSNPLSPDLVVAGAIGPGNDAFIGIFGDEARIFDFTTGAFGAAAQLDECLGDGGVTPFFASSATMVDLTGSGSPILSATTAGSAALYGFFTAGLCFGIGIGQPVTCSSSANINADIIVGAAIPGVSPIDAGAGDALVLIEGTGVHFLQAVSPGVCFSDALPLVDQGGSPLNPDFAFGWDFDGNGSDDLILVDTVTM